MNLTTPKERETSNEDESKGLKKKCVGGSTRRML